MWVCQCHPSSMYYYFHKVKWVREIITHATMWECLGVVSKCGVVCAFLTYVHMHRCTYAYISISQAPLILLYRTDNSTSVWILDDESFHHLPSTCASIINATYFCSTKHWPKLSYILITVNYQKLQSRNIFTFPEVSGRLNIWLVIALHKLSLNKILALSKLGLIVGIDCGFLNASLQCKVLLSIILKTY